MVQTSQALIQDLKEFGEPIHALISHSFGGGCSILAHSMGLAPQKIVLIAAPASTQAIFDRFSKLIRLNRKASAAFQKLVEKEAGRSVRELDLMDLAKDFTLPGLIVHDPGDQDVPFAESLEMHRTWKGSKHIETKDLGHRRILKSPDIIQKVIEFLSSDLHKI
jgi:pimeloyl-ACP methyl ester carboxylesterase